MNMKEETLDESDVEHESSASSSTYQHPIDKRTEEISESTLESCTASDQSISPNRIQIRLKLNDYLKYEPVERAEIAMKTNNKKHRSRGRPRVTEPSTIPQQVFENCSEEELKYLEARCKNNEASRRSRLKQKKKANEIFDLLKVEGKRHEALTKINAELDKEILQLRKNITERSNKRLKS